MLFIRCLVLLLCLVCALSVFVACNTGTGSETTASGETSGNAGENTTGEETNSSTAIKINISDYSVYIPENATSNEQAAASALLVAVNNLGAEFKYSGTDFVSSTAEIDPNAYEILLGNTNRSESTAALEDLTGVIGYVVKMIGNKIVVNASTPELMDEAIQYFITTYVATGSAGSFEIPESLNYVNKDAGGIILVDVENADFLYNMVFSNDLDTTQGSDQYDRVDYVVQYFTKLWTELQAKTGISDITIDGDNDTASADKLEILLGDTNRPETETFRQSLNFNEYGYGVVGNKLVITGWSDLTIGKAVDLFITDLGNLVVEGQGCNNIVVLASDTKIVSHDRWDMTLPMYNDGRAEKVIECANDSYEIFYSGTTLDAYKAYCETLLANGYKAYQTNQIADNHFGTYVNAKTMIHVYYVDYEKSVRFITEPMSTAVLPQLTDSNTGEKITDLSFTMFDLDNKAGNFGNCFIMTMEDGSFIVHDGGGDSGGKDKAELWNVLQKMNKRKDGKVVIAAWFISHQHWDHCKNMIDMLNTNYKHIKLERVIFNVSVESFFYNTRNPNNYVNVASFTSLMMKTGAEVVRMHTGQKIQVRTLTIEVMYTTEDIYPRHPYTFNNTGLVQRFDIGEGENKQRMYILGDIEDVASGIMCDMYGDELKTDIMQVAHHGGGGTVDLYRYFSPTVVVWPQNQASVDNHLKSTSTGYYPTINKSLMNQKNVVLLVVADNGHKTIPLPVLGLGTNRDQNYSNIVINMPRDDGVTSQ